MEINPDMLSPYSKQLAKDPRYKSAAVKKLVPNLHHKKKYILHYRNLKLYLEMGRNVMKIHRILQFKQAPWLKSYIDLNTEKWMKSKNDFKKEFFKLMNNSVFGKTMEDIRRHINIELVTDEKKLKKWG